MGPEEQAALEQLMAQAPANVGPVSQPQSNQGNVAAGMEMIKNAINMLQQALPLLPMGGELHDSAVNSVKMLSKHVESTQENQGLQMSGLVELIKNMSANAPMQQMAAAFPDASGQPPAGAPAMVA